MEITVSAVLQLDSECRLVFAGVFLLCESLCAVTLVQMCCIPSSPAPLETFPVSWHQAELIVSAGLKIDA